MDALKITEHGDTITVEVQVTPRSSRSVVQGLYDGCLKVLLNAPPVDGEANEALIALFAKLLKVPKRQIELVRGQQSRRKTLSITGSNVDAVRALIPK